MLYAYGLDDQGIAVQHLVGGKSIYYSMSSRPALGLTQPPIQWVLRALFAEVKRPGSEADHSPPVAPRLKKRAYTSILPYVFMA
jgi:hypothetical protein